MTRSTGHVAPVSTLRVGFCCRGGETARKPTTKHATRIDKCTARRPNTRVQNEADINEGPKPAKNKSKQGVITGRFLVAVEQAQPGDQLRVAAVYVHELGERDERVAVLVRQPWFLRERITNQQTRAMSTRPHARTASARTRTQMKTTERSNAIERARCSANAFCRVVEKQRHAHEEAARLFQRDADDQLVQLLRRALPEKKTRRANRSVRGRQ